MNGQLRDHPLAELITEISAERLSGALRLARARVKAIVHFDDGQIAAARTNLRLHRLDESLKRWEAIAAAQLDALVAKEMTDAQAAAALIAAGAISKDELRKFQVRQTEDTLRPLLLWTDGEWVYDARARVEESDRISFDVRRILLEAARRLPLEFIASRLKDAAEIIAPTGTPPDDLGLLPEEAFVLSRVDAPVSVGDLITISGLAEGRTRQVVYALLLSGVVRRGAGANVFTAEALKWAQEARPATSPGASRPRSGATGKGPRTGGSADAPDPQAELDFLFLRAGGATHYDVLEVARSARADDIKRAYYALARRLHPDRFRNEGGDSLRPRIEFAFSKITQAYEVLKDAALRAAYDLKLEQAGQTTNAPQRPQNFAGAAPERGEQAHKQSPAAAAPGTASPQYRAEECFQQGLAALQQKNLVLATKSLGEAALLMPKQARYRALYGRALTFNRQTRRQAESELQAAIALDAQNASFRVMLAELYQEIGLTRRAEGELERALALEPDNQAARALLETLRGATESGRN